MSEVLSEESPGASEPGSPVARRRKNDRADSYKLDISADTPDDSRISSEAGLNKRKRGAGKYGIPNEEPTENDEGPTKAWGTNYDNFPNQKEMKAKVDLDKGEDENAEMEFEFGPSKRK